MSSERVPIPNSDFSVKPKYIDCIKRRNIYRSTNPNGYDPNTTIRIPIDTGTAGSLLDHRTACLEFTLRIINTSFAVDYINFDAVGACAFIKEFRLMCNSNFAEKIERYNVCMNTRMNQSGINQDPLCIFSSNQFYPHEGYPRTTSVNFVKPSMVDCMGNPMYQSRLFLDQNCANEIYLGSPPEGGRYGAGTGKQVFANMNDSQVAGSAVKTAALGDYCALYTYGNYQNMQPPFYAKSYGVDPAGDEGKLSASTLATANAGAFYHSAIYLESSANPGFKASAEQLVGRTGGGHPTLTAAYWPLGQPGKANLESHATHRWADRMRFLSNVKNFPVGLSVSKSETYYKPCNPFNPAASSSSSTSLSPRKETTVRCSAHLYSGLIGVLAERMFPAMLIGQQKLWIEIDTAPNEQFFQVGLDPCRRLPGTIRDFAPFLFMKEGASGDELAGLNIVLQLSNHIHNSKNNPGLLISPSAAGGTVQFYQSSGPVDPEQTGLPHGIPQYVPVAKPWTAKIKYEATAAPNATLNIEYTNERNVLYGTYLPAAVAQVKGTFLGTRNKEPQGDYTSYYTGSTLSYRIEVLQLFIDEMVLPASYGAALVAHAENGTIAYSTKFLKSSEQIMPINETQNFPIVVQASSLCQLTLLFQSGIQLYSDKAYLYNSFATYCPFTSLQFTQAKYTGEAAAAALGAVPFSGAQFATADDVFDVGGTYTLRGSLRLVDSLGWNLVLQVNQTYFPRVPIQNPQELLMEYEKGIETIALPSARTNCKGRLVREFSISGTTETSSNTLEYDWFGDDYWSVFIPIEALDDQTITGNPHFTVVENCPDNYTTYGHKRIRGLRCPSNPSVDKTAPPYVDSGISYKGVLNKFMPSDGKFQLVYSFERALRGGAMAQGGTAVQNSQVILNATNMHFCTHYVGALQPAVVCTAVAYMDALVIFSGFGNMTTQF